jgi:hypothetical protein
MHYEKSFKKFDDDNDNDMIKPSVHGIIFAILYFMSA